MDDKPSTASEWGKRNHYKVVAYWKQSEPLTRISITPACVPAPGHAKNLLQPFLFQCCSSLWQKGQYWERRRTNLEQKQLGPGNWVLDQASNKMVLATEQWKIPSSHLDLVLALACQMITNKQKKKPNNLNVECCVYSVRIARTSSLEDSISSHPKRIVSEEMVEGVRLYRSLKQGTGSLKIKRFLLIKENQIYAIKEFSTLLFMENTSICAY